MSCIDIAKVRIEDCHHIFRNKFNKPEDTARELVSYWSNIVIITLGVKVSIIETRSKIYNIHAIDVEVIDITGAGYTFTSGFPSEYLVSQNIKRSGIFAAATASLPIEKTGGVNIERLPGREQVLDRMVIYKED